MRKIRYGLCVAIALGLSARFASAQNGGEPASEVVTEEKKSLVDLPVAMESQPYRVRVLIAHDPAEFPALRREVDQALSRSVGLLWQTDIEELSGVVRRDGDVLARWTAAEIQQRCDDEEVGFWFLVTVHNQGARREIAVRAWQPQFEWLSPVQRASFFEPRETAAQIVKLCWRLFRPQVLIEHVDQNAVRLRIPAGDLQPADPAYQLFQPGDCLIPWMLYYDKNQTIKRRQELPWTYVRLDEIQGPLARGTVLSGLRTPLAGKTRGRIDKVAVASRPVYPNTRLQIGVQNQPSRVLAGYPLELRPKLPEPKSEVDAAPKADDVEAEPPVKEEITKLLTDRLGETTLTPIAEQKMTWVYIYSGDLLLARVPFVPGSLPFMRLEVPDDSVRLQVEGELQVLQSELINFVAERNTLIAAARGASKKGDWQRVAILRKQLDELPPKKIFTSKLAGIRVPAVNAAKANKDRNGQVRVERLCNDVAELIDRYLDSEKLRLITDEIDQLMKDGIAAEKEAQ